MSVVTIILLFNIYLLAQSITNDYIINRFFPPNPYKFNFITGKYPDVPLPQISEPLPQLIDENSLDIHEFNKYVEYNNKGVECSKNNDLVSAINFYKEALKINPSSQNTWLNLLSALHRQESNPQEIIHTSLKIIALFKDEINAPYIAAVNAYNKLNNSELAIAFLQELLKRKPDHLQGLYLYAYLLFEKKYFDHAFEIISNFLKPPTYENTNLALIAAYILDKKERYHDVIKLLKDFLPFDKDGKLHDLYLTSKFFSGDLPNLANEISSALSKFPNIPNRKVLEEFQFKLKEHEYEVTRIITIKLPSPENYSNFEVSFSFPLNIPDYQFVDFKEVVVERSTYKTYFIPLSELKKTNKPNKFVVNINNPLSNIIKVKAVSKVKVRPYFAQKGFYNMDPPIHPEEIRKNSDVNFNDLNLNKIYDKLANQPGNFLQNAVISIYHGLKYKRNSIDYDISWIFNNLDECDCTEYTLLLFALCIKRGLPARMVNGYIYELKNDDKESSVGHAWCEVYFKNKGWVPIDVTNFSSLKWATFGHMLSDTIVFDYYYNTQEKEYSVSYISNSNSKENIELENTYKVKLIR